VAMRLSPRAPTVGPTDTFVTELRAGFAVG
jgi:hypothetical protein